MHECVHACVCIQQSQQNLRSEHICLKDDEEQIYIYTHTQSSRLILHVKICHQNIAIIANTKTFHQAQQKNKTKVQLELKMKNVSHQACVHYQYFSFCMPFTVSLHTTGFLLLVQFTSKNCLILGDSGGVVNSLDFCPALLKSLGCFYFWCILS